MRGKVMRWYGNYTSSVSNISDVLEYQRRLNVFQKLFILMSTNKIELFSLCIIETTHIIRGRPTVYISHYSALNKISYNGYVTTSQIRWPRKSTDCKPPACISFFGVLSWLQHLWKIWKSARCLRRVKN